MNERAKQLESLYPRDRFANKIMDAITDVENELHTLVLVHLLMEFSTALAFQCTSSDESAESVLTGHLKYLIEFTKKENEEKQNESST